MQKWLATFAHFLDAKRSCEETEESSRKRSRVENGEKENRERPSFDPFSAPSIPVATSSLRSAVEPNSSSTSELSCGADEVRVPADRFRMANAPSSNERAEGRTNDARVQWGYHRQAMILQGKDPDGHEADNDDQDGGEQDQKTQEEG